GLAPAWARLLRQRASGPAALRDRRARLRAANLVAGSLRPGYAGRRVPPGARPARRRAGDPQGLPSGDRLVLGVSRKRPQDADRPRRLFARARLRHGYLVRPRDRFLRALLGARRARGRVRGARRARRLPRHRHRRFGRKGAGGDARRRGRAYLAGGSTRRRRGRFSTTNCRAGAGTAPAPVSIVGRAGIGRRASEGRAGAAPGFLTGFSLGRTSMREPSSLVPCSPAIAALAARSVAISTQPWRSRAPVFGSRAISALNTMP